MIDDKAMSRYLKRWMDENPNVAYALFVLDDEPDLAAAMIGRNDVAPGTIGRILAETARALLALEQ